MSHHKSHFSHLEMWIIEPVDGNDQLELVASPPTESCRKCIWRDIQNPFHIQSIRGTLWNCTATGLILAVPDIDSYACEHYDPRED